MSDSYEFATHTSYWESRQVSWDSYIEVRGNRYSVPAPLVGHRASVRLTLDGVVRIYDGETPVAEHRLQPATQGWVTVPAHHTALWRQALEVERRPLAVYEEVASWQLASLLDRLKMEHLQAQLDPICEQASKADLDYKAFLAQALDVEWRGRYQHGVESRLKQARFPWVKTVDQFDLAFQPSIDRKVIPELAGLSFLERTENVVLLGPPGVGKTHLGIALGVKAVLTPRPPTKDRRPRPSSSFSLP